MAVYTFLEHTWLSFKEAEESIPSPPPGSDRSSGERISRVKRKRGLAAWWADNPHPPPPLLCVFSKMEERCWECGEPGGYKQQLILDLLWHSLASLLKSGYWGLFHLHG
ncbi:hypothetical protein MHYP_G00268470 [Metynnis hypsauchen]